MSIVFETTNGIPVTIDEDDADAVLLNKWYASPAVRGTPRFYIMRRQHGTTMYLHRLIMSAPKGIDVDHINHDTTDNRRCNLRLATRTENNANAFMGRKAASVRGTQLCKGGRWATRLQFRGVTYRAGRFDTQEEAARAYDELASIYFGKFAILNFPEDMS